MNRPNTSPRSFVPARGATPSRADVSGPLPQFSMDPAASASGARSASAADDSFDQAPTLVRPALDPARAAAVLRAIERRRPTASPVVIEELGADALVDVSGGHAALPHFAEVDTIAPVMSTSEIRFFDAESAVAALEHHDHLHDHDHDDLDHPAARPLPSPDRARFGRRAVSAVVGFAGVVLLVGTIVAVARPSEASSAVEEIYALARADANSSRSLQAARAAAAAPAPTEVAPAPTTGTLDTPKDLAAQTLFVDGIAMGRGPVTLACGRHGVRVGKAGVTKSLEVPCGGKVVAR